MYQLLEGHGVIPVIKFSDVSEALPLADALSAGGINVMEITFRSDAAYGAIKKVAAEKPDILVGAGTVVNVAQLEQAIDAGAKFVVSPGFDPEIVETGLKAGLIMLPGVITPSEIMAAMKLGLTILKYFPASVFGGLKAIKTYASVFGNVKFMPTGGVSAANLAEFLAVPNIQACGGSWMCSGEMIKEQKWDEITKLSAEATAIYQSVRG
ncbi:MAG: bifunctional 4-hydroxy-2-oxoglutarate aldolase/2-dehydro-3-deoxy-phosphogluconate aldolase [Clostridiaceae bacterium]|nr:bifunctional 4-hydroxy-2-oxoglutarate aldolase/2-dehydro-3-deoxy-phosphogluconate aldolase [Clostridiaceae bacterium]